MGEMLLIVWSLKSYSLKILPVPDNLLTPELLQALNSYSCREENVISWNDKVAEKQMRKHKPAGSFSSQIYQ